jgi:hypothetical protein
MIENFTNLKLGAHISSVCRISATGREMFWIVDLFGVGERQTG